MSFYNRTDELALLPANRTSYPESVRTPARGFFAGLVARYAAMVQRHAAMVELNDLTDRELADIGLTRAEVPHIFDEGFLRAR